MFTVQYLCTFRPVWYDDDLAVDWTHLQQAVWRAIQIQSARQTSTRVLDAYGRQVWLR